MEDTPLDGRSRLQRRARNRRAYSEQQQKPRGGAYAQRNHDHGAQPRRALLRGRAARPFVGEDAAVVEGERQLTIRLLEGTRPLGQTETPVPNSSDGAAGQRRLLHLEVADAQDPYFYML